MTRSAEPKPVRVSGPIPGFPMVDLPVDANGMEWSCSKTQVQPFADGGIVKTTSWGETTYLAYGEATRRIASLFGLTDSRDPVEERMRHALESIGQPIPPELRDAAKQPEAPGNNRYSETPDAALLKAAIVGFYRNHHRITNPDTPPILIEPWGTDESAADQIARYASLVEEATR